MESLLAAELQSLGAESVTEKRAGVAFRGPLSCAYRACLWSRIANRILLVLARFPASTADELYEGVRSIPWYEHLDAKNTIAVEFHSSRSAITHTHYGALRVKDAVVDQLRERTGSRPSVLTTRPDIRINAYLLKDEATISLDLSGDSLHRRGYREEGLSAPLKENLAAAILVRAGWPEIASGGGALVDPMCGSGTLPIEAALMAADIAPGLLRAYWGFPAWKQHDPAAWDLLLEEAGSRREQGLLHLPSIRGYDHNPTAVRAALMNVEQAGLHGRLHIEKRELEDCAPARPDDHGLLIANPPYGERLGADTDLPALYTRLGNTLKDQFQGWRAAVFTGNPPLGKRLGLQATRVHNLYNGPIPCKLLHLEIKPERYLSSRRTPAPLPAGTRGEGATMFSNRLRKRQKHLRRWLQREGISCYRLYDADLPEYAVAVDVYEANNRWVHVQEYEAPKSVDARKARIRLREALGVVLEVLEVPEDQLFFKIRQKQRGKSQYGKLSASKHFHEVPEGGHHFLVNFEDYLDTGLFLDHRITRRLLEKLSDGQDFLNLFAYTGTATVYAAAGGARTTTTVDMSNTYLEWARRNMQLNKLAGSQHRYIRANCLEWLKKTTDPHRYGLIFLDPPSFSTSSRMEGTFDVQRDHATLIHQTIRLLKPGGILIFANNRQRFRMDHDALSGLQIEDITPSTIPADFERNRKIHQCWRISLPKTDNQ